MTVQESRTFCSNAVRNFLTSLNNQEIYYVKMHVHAVSCGSRNVAENLCELSNPFILALVSYACLRR